MFKKIIGLLIVSALFAATAAIAAEDVNATGGQLVLGSNSADLTIGLSKGVEVRYVNPGADAAAAQWYIAASVHSGGNKGYATAQNLTNIMVMDYAPGSDTSTVLDNIQETAASKEDWPAGWSAQ